MNPAGADRIHGCADRQPRAHKAGGVCPHLLGGRQLWRTLNAAYVMAAGIT